MLAQDRHHQLVVVLAPNPRPPTKATLLDERRLPVRADGTGIIDEDVQLHPVHAQVLERAVHQRPDGVLSEALPQIAKRPPLQAASSSRGDGI